MSRSAINPAVPAWLRSGWVPTLLVVLLAAVLIHGAAHVSIRDIVAFAVYLIAWIVLPGTAVWRLVDPRQRTARRPLAEDLAIGALVGYVLEFPAYLLCLAAGLPRLYLAWPVLVLAGAWALRRRHSVFHLGEPPSERSWRWTTGILMAYLVLWFNQNSWTSAPTTETALRNPFVDAPFHLSLAVGLRHVFPPRYPYVADTPLEYHWLSHLHVAAASWVTGTEPAVLLRSLSLPVLLLIVAFATARVAVRLTGTSWTQPVTLAALLVVPASFSGWRADTVEGLLSNRLLASPSAGFVNAALLLGCLLVIETLISRRTGWAVTGLTAVTFVAMGGAKSTSLPTVMAGLAGATLVCSLLERRLHKTGAALTALSVVALFAVQLLVIGRGAHGLEVSPLAWLTTRGVRYPSLLSPDGSMAPAVKAVILVSLTAYLSLGASLLALLLQGGWRRAESVFLVITCAAGFGASLVFHQGSSSEYYFLYVVLLPMVLGAVLGLHHVVRTMPPGFAGIVCGAGFSLGLLGATVLDWVTDDVNPERLSGPRAWQAFTLYAVPVLVMAGIVVVIVPLSAMIGSILTRRPDLARAGWLPALLLVVAGLGGLATARQFRTLVTDPAPAPEAVRVRPDIAAGGIEAARWIRSNTPDDEVIATNAHCRQPRQPPCDVRNFWMAAYSERTMLVEGWAYIYWSGMGKATPEGQGPIRGPFWDPARLEINDEALMSPTKASVQELRERYDVRWVLIDTRYPYDGRGLRRYARTVYKDAGYLVLELG